MRQVMQNHRSTHHLILTARPSLHRLARRVAKRYGWRIREDEAMSIADLAMCQAARRFRDDSGAQFVTFAYPWVWGALARALRKQQRSSGAELVEESLTRSPTCASPPPAADVVAATKALTRSLDERQRWLATAHVLGGLSLAEASARLGRSRTWGHRQWRHIKNQVQNSRGVDAPV